MEILSNVALCLWTFCYEELILVSHFTDLTERARSSLLTAINTVKSALCGHRLIWGSRLEDNFYPLELNSLIRHLQVIGTVCVYKPATARPNKAD